MPPLLLKGIFITGIYYEYIRNITLLIKLNFKAILLIFESKNAFKLRFNRFLIILLHMVCINYYEYMFL